MAGIGFELRKIYGRKTLEAKIWGTFYATMTTVGPMVLSMVLMLLVNLMMGWDGVTQMENRFFISAVTYAFLMALMIAAFLNNAVARYISDCIYKEEEEYICGSAFGVLALSTSFSGIMMLMACAYMYFSDDSVPLPFLAGYYFLGVLVTGTYSVMNYVSAMKHYKHITYSYLLGIFAAAAVHLMCSRWLGMSKLTSGCFALTCCYFIILSAMLLLGVRSLGVRWDRCFDYLSYFKKYPDLVFCGFAYMLTLYLPTMVYWFLSGMSEQVSIFRTTPMYDQAMFLALTVNTPSVIIFVVKVETAFYERYATYVSALNNGTYELIEKERISMCRALIHQLFFVFEIQLIITVVAIGSANVFFPYMGLSARVLSMFNVLGLGVYAVFCMYYTIIVFHYFADYTGACIGTIVFLAVTALCIAVSLMVSFYTLPLLIGGLCGWIASFLLMLRRMKKLNSYLMCKNY